MCCGTIKTSARMWMEHARYISVVIAPEAIASHRNYPVESVFCRCMLCDILPGRPNPLRRQNPCTKTPTNGMDKWWWELLVTPISLFVKLSIVRFSDLAIQAHQPAGRLKTSSGHIMESTPGSVSRRREGVAWCFAHPSMVQARTHMRNSNRAMWHSWTN